MLKWNRTEDGDYEATGYLIVRQMSGYFALFLSAKPTSKALRTGTLYECQREAEMRNSRPLSDDNR